MGRAGEWVGWGVGKEGVGVGVGGEGGRRDSEPPDSEARRESALCQAREPPEEQTAVIIRGELSGWSGRTSRWGSS